MDYSGKNIFNIVNPQTYGCTIWSYRVSHSVLLVRVDKGKLDDEVFYLNFEGVLYFEGPLSWMGADFRTGTDDECIKLLHKRGFKNIPKDELLDKFGLFTVKLSNFEVVKILSSKNTEKTVDIPPDFTWLASSK